MILDVRSVTGKPPSLRYQIQNNKGTARVVHGDNIVCRAEIFSGLHSNGELMIKSRGNARCTDGSRYPMPEVSCKSGTSDVAECSARYDAKTVVPLTFKKQVPDPMLVNLCDYKQSVTLIANSGVQFLDFGLTPGTPPAPGGLSAKLPTALCCVLITIWSMAATRFRRRAAASQKS